MDILALIAERRIGEAIAQGAFDRLENAGKRIELDDPTWVPEDLRMPYRILKNAGCLPPELELRNEIISLRDLIRTLDDDSKRLVRLRELNFRLVKLGEMRRRPLTLDALPEYEQKLFDRLAG